MPLHRTPGARLAAGAGAFAIALAAAGCGGSGRDQGPAKVETTKVKVVEGLGRGRDFNPEAIYHRLSPGVVTITSLFDSPAALLRGGGEGGQGSGFVVGGDGYIATNAHVVTTGKAPREKRAKQVFVSFADGNRVPAHIVGDDPFSDVALIKVNPRGLSLTPLGLGRSSELKVGDPVAAIGSPFGEEQSLTIGVTSALDRTIESLTAFQIGNAIQTDAAINPGNSGGPLLSAKGQVIGINAQIKSQSGGGEGVGFAIPVDAVRRSLRELRGSGHVRYGYLGVTTEPLYPQLADRIGVPVKSGALVRDVIPGSPADKAGIKSGGKKISFQGDTGIPGDGDVITAVDGGKLTHENDISDVVSRKRPGDKVELEVYRGSDKRTVTATLGARPLRAPEQP
jgi:S1-C subfamily serine protease